MTWLKGKGDAKGTASGGRSRDECSLISVLPSLFSVLSVHIYSSPLSLLSLSVLGTITLISNEFRIRHDTEKILFVVRAKPTIASTLCLSLVFVRDRRVALADFEKKVGLLASGEQVELKAAGSRFVKTKARKNGVC